MYVKINDPLIKGVPKSTNLDLFSTYHSQYLAFSYLLQFLTYPVVMKRSTIAEIISFLFIILFLYTGASKIIDYDVAKEQIALSPLLAPIAGFVVIFIPTLEALTSILLFFPKTRLYGLRSAFFLMLAFTGYVIYLLNYNDHLPCTCGGVLEQLSWPQHLILNGGLIVLSLWALFLLRRSNNPRGHKSGLHPQL